MKGSTAKRKYERRKNEKKKVLQNKNMMGLEANRLIQNNILK